MLNKALVVITTKIRNNLKIHWWGTEIIGILLQL